MEVSSQHMTASIMRRTDLISAMPEMTGGRLPEGLCRLQADWLDWTSQTGVFTMAERLALPCVSKFPDVLRDEFFDLPAQP